MRGGLISTPGGEDSALFEESTFGMSQRMEAELLKKDRERQIAVAIESMKVVRRARVLLAIPRENVFARDKRKPSATVVLTLNKQILKQEEINSIVDTVTTAVHGLEPNKVTVTDQTGRLLNSGSHHPCRLKPAKSLSSAKRRRIPQKNRRYFNSGVSGALYRSGCDLDFSQLEQTRKTYNPDLPSVRLR